MYYKSIVDTLQLNMCLSQVFGIDVVECELSSKAKVYLLTNTLEIDDELIRYVPYMHIQFIALVLTFKFHREPNIAFDKHDVLLAALKFDVSFAPLVILSLSAVSSRILPYY